MRKLKSPLHSNEMTELIALLNSWQPEVPEADLWPLLATVVGGDRNRLPPQPPIAVEASFGDGLSDEALALAIVEVELAWDKEAFVLSREQEEMLARQKERGGVAGEKALEILVNANLHLVTSMVTKYQNQGIATEDLIQEGTLGLIRAADKYDWRRGFRFSTYAIQWIRQTLGRAIDEKGRTIRQGHPPSESMSRLGDLPPTDEVFSPVASLFRQALRNEINKALEHLSEREKEILTLRYGLSEDQAQPMTLEQVGKQLQLSREQARQVEAEALKKLRRSPLGGRLRDPEPPEVVSG